MPRTVSQLTPQEASVIMGTFLQDCLGTYTYDSGQTRVAVSINKPKEDKFVTGLELIVPVWASSRIKAPFWKFYLIDRQNEMTGLATALARINATFLRPNIVFLPALEALEAMPQASFTISAGEIIELGKKLKVIN